YHHLASLTSYFNTLFLHHSLRHVTVHTFPTRRSSDLDWNSYRSHSCRSDDPEVRVERCDLSSFRRERRHLYCRSGGSYGSRTDQDRKSTRLNSSHVSISYAVFCLKKKINTKYPR